MRILTICMILLIPPVEAGEKQIQCLAKNIYYEARGEPESGQYAVAHVTLNRVADTRFPNTICKVVYQKDQFTWTANPYSILEPKAWKRSKHIARQAIDAYQTGEDVSKGAVYFHSGSRKKRYHRILTTRIAKHAFYQ